MKNLFNLCVGFVFFAVIFSFVSCKTEVDNSETEPTYYTVTFDTDGGSSVASQSVESGKTAVEPKSPTKTSTETTSFTFAGWYNGTSEFDFSTPIKADITLTAHWTETAIPKTELETYTVTFNANGGTISVASQEIAANTTTALTATATLGLVREGYQFVGWAMNANEEKRYADGAEIALTENITLYALWEVIPAGSHIVTFNTNGGSVVVAQTVSDGDTANEPAAPTKLGYTFEGWYRDSALASVYDFATTVTANIMLYVKWTATTYTITYDLDGGANDVVNPLTYTIESETITLASPSKDGYEFTGWYNSGVKITQISKGTTGNLTLTAHWAVIPQTEETGTLQFTFDIADSTMKNAKIGLYDRTTGEAIAGFSEELFAITTNAIVYEKSAVPAGTYSLKAFFYTDSANILIASVQELVTILADNRTIIEREISADSDIYTISYELNGGTWTSGFSPTTQFTKYSGRITLPIEENLSRTAYFFDGWYTTETLSGEKVTEITELTKSVTLYAKWSENCRVYASDLATVDFTDTVFTSNKLIQLVGEWSSSDIRTLGTLLKASKYTGYYYAIDMSEATGVTEIPKEAFMFNWDGVTARITKVVLPATLKTIGEFAFCYCSYLSEVTIPSSVTSIGKGAFFTSGIKSLSLPSGITRIEDSTFYKCENLESIEIPEGVTYIGSSVFTDCKSLKSANIPASMTECNVSFGYCTSLTTVTISAKLTSIPNSMFYDCESLTDVTIPDTVTSIGEYAFWGCKKFSGAIPSSVRSIGEGAFTGCGFTEIEIPNGLKEIAKRAFTNCRSLTSITIPDSVASIGEHAFESCASLKTFVFSNSVKTIGHTAFFNCPIETVQYNGSLSDWLSISFDTNEGNACTNPCNNGAKLYLNGTELTVAEIPNTITAIGDSVFEGCASLTSIVIPDSVESIGVYAFSKCKNITSIEIPASVKTIGNYAFFASSIASVYYNGSLADWLSLSFVSEKANPCYGGSKLYLNKTELTEAEIPSTITEIGLYAFYGCKSLVKVTLSSVTSIGTKAFYNCSNLSEFYAQSLSESGWEAITKGSNWATNIASGAKVYLSENKEIEL